MLGRLRWSGQGDRGRTQIGGCPRSWDNVMLKSMHATPCSVLLSEVAHGVGDTESGVTQAEASSAGQWRQLQWVQETPGRGAREGLWILLWSLLKRWGNKWRKMAGGEKIPWPLLKWKGRFYLRLLHQGREIGFNSEYSKGEWGLQPRSSMRSHGQKTVKRGHQEWFLAKLVHVDSC